MENRRRAQGALSLLVGSGRSECPATALERRDLARSILGAEDPTTAEMLLGRYVDGLTHEEIGARFGVTERTVRNRIQHALERVRARHPSMRFRSILLLVLSAGVASAALVGGLDTELSRRRDPEAPAPIRIKGTQPIEAASELDLLVARSGTYFRIGEIETHPGDLLVLRYTAGQAFLVVLDVSSSGTRVLFGAEPAAQRVPPATNALLRVGFRLDEEPDDELIIAAMASSPVEVDALVSQVERIDRLVAESPRGEVVESTTGVDLHERTLFAWRVKKEKR